MTAGCVIGTRFKAGSITGLSFSGISLYFLSVNRLRATAKWTEWHLGLKGSATGRITTRHAGRTPRAGQAQAADKLCDALAEACPIPGVRYQNPRLLHRNVNSGQGRRQGRGHATSHWHGQLETLRYRDPPASPSRHTKAVWLILPSRSIC